MGFFSWNCKECGKSIRSEYSTCKYDEWMKFAVAKTAGGKTFIGEYNGYGRMDGISLTEREFTLYHNHCWENAGRPEYQGLAENAEDQGFFVDTDKALCAKCDNHKCDGHPNYQVYECGCGEKHEASEFNVCLSCAGCWVCCECDEPRHHIVDKRKKQG